MGLFSTMIQLQLQLFLLMAVGYFCKYIGILNDESKKSLSDLLIYVILPCNIINSFTSGIEVSSELIFNCFLSVAISCVIQIVSIYGGKLLFRNYPENKASAAKYALIVSNSSFIGIPVAECMYGNLGVLYTAIFQIPSRFTMWSAGLSLFTNVDRKETIKKVVTHPCVIACVGGFFLMLGGVTIPGFFGKTIASLSKCTSPVSMLVIGAILCGTDKKQLFKKDVLFFCFVRLILVAVITYVPLRALGVDRMISGMALIMTAMPAGSTTAILAQKYGCDAEYAAALIFTSTLLSIITIPILSIII